MPVKRIKNILLSFCLLLMFGCSDPSTEFFLSRYNVNLVPGDTAVVFVGGELEFALESSDGNVVTAHREGRKAILTAKNEGKASVMFLSQFNDIVCNITVKDSLNANLDEKLADATPRISGSGVSLVYGVPGILITQSDKLMGFVNIDSGEEVVLTFASGGIDCVKINGIERKVSAVTLYKETSDRLWYLVLLDDKSFEGFWAVIEKSI